MLIIDRNKNERIKKQGCLAKEKRKSKQMGVSGGRVMEELKETQMGQSSKAQINRDEASSTTNKTVYINKLIRRYSLI